MSPRLRILKEQLKNKEQELLVLQNKARRMENEYRMVRYTPHLEWYGRDCSHRAQSMVRQTEQEIANIKRNIPVLEKRETA